MLRELAKAVEYGLIESSANIASMLLSEDKDYIEMGKAMTQMLREQRLGI